LEIDWNIAAKILPEVFDHLKDMIVGVVEKDYGKLESGATHVYTDMKQQMSNPEVRKEIVNRLLSGLKNHILPGDMVTWSDKEYVVKEIHEHTLTLRDSSMYLIDVPWYSVRKIIYGEFTCPICNLPVHGWGKCFVNGTVVHTTHREDPEGHEYIPSYRVYVQ
jgi:hypothetical protein